MDNKKSAPYEWIALRCQSGEMSAFEDLVAVMERPLLYYAASLTGSQDSGLDVLQEVWIRVLRDIRKLKDPGSLRSWLQVAPNLNAAILPFLADEERFTVTIFIPRITHLS